MNVLKIGWASPWNKISSIAALGTDVIQELVHRGHQVTILRTEVGEAANMQARPAPGPIRRLSDYSDDDLRQQFDIIVAQFGDSYKFHGGLLPRIREVQVVGIFHDASITNLIRQWVNDDPSALKHFPLEIYGAMPLHWDDFAYASQHHPMTEWIAQRVVAAVVHANHYVERVRSTCPGPTIVIPLPYHLKDLPPLPSFSSKTIIAVFGHVDPNKRIDQLILAIGASPFLRHRCHIRIIGEASPRVREQLIHQAKAVGTHPPEFTGWASDDDLRFHLRDVNVICCLRNPILKGASASFVLAMLSGRPTIVSGHGCYVEPPSDAILTCAPEQEALDVMHHLEHIVRDPIFSLQIGRLGRHYALVKHAPKIYAENLELFLNQVISRMPISSARSTMVSTLSDFGLHHNDPATSRITRILSDLIPA